MMPEVVIPRYWPESNTLVSDRLLYLPENIDRSLIQTLRGLRLVMMVDGQRWWKRLECLM